MLDTASHPALVSLVAAVDRELTTGGAYEVLVALALEEAAEAKSAADPVYWLWRSGWRYLDQLASGRPRRDPKSRFAFRSQARLALTHRSVRWVAHPRRVGWWAIVMNGVEPSTSPPALPRWFGPRASPDDPTVSALIDRVARGAGWVDIGGGFNLNLRIDAEPPVVLRVHRPWVRHGRVAGLRRLRERLQRTQVRVARPIPLSGGDVVRVADRWAELEEFIDHVRPRANEDSYVRLFAELGRFHSALKAVWEPSPPEPLDDHRTFGQLRYSVGFTRRRLGRRSEPVVHRMRQLTGELSKLRKEVELPCTPIHGDYKFGNAGELSDGSWATFDLDFVRARERLYDIAGSLNHVAQSGPDGVGQPVDLLEPRRLLDAYESTAPEPLTRDEHRWLPGALALIPLHWAATAGLVGDGIHEAESAMTAAEAWWSRRAELSS
jgi:Ser/Thr protein kinase RdoA (MazF antagonist)